LALGTNSTGAADSGQHGAATGENPAMSFIMLDKSQTVPPPPVFPISTNGEKRSRKPEPSKPSSTFTSEKSQKAIRLFEILSSRTDVDHPICTECTELLVTGLQDRLNSTLKERDAYVDFLKKLNADMPTEEEHQKRLEELEEVKQQEAAAFVELRDLEQQKAAVDEEIMALEEESRQLDIEEEKFWRDRNAFALKLAEFQNERDGVNMQYDHDTKQLERLHWTNVYNDTFCISHDGSYVTINGLRLGRLSSPSIEWSEINAALGQTILLLVVVAEKLNFTFQNYRLYPIGSTSRIEKIESLHPAASTISGATNASISKAKVISWNLHSAGGITEKLSSSFSNALEALLDCVRQLGEHLHAKFDYEIRKEKIGRENIGFASIRYGFQNGDEWTKACKYMLTYCKFLLAHASNLDGGGREGRRSSGA
jgi:beclin 1